MYTHTRLALHPYQAEHSPFFTTAILEVSNNHHESIYKNNHH